MEKEQKAEMAIKLVLVGELEEWEGVYYGMINSHREVLLKSDEEDPELSFLGKCRDGNFWYSLGRELKDHFKNKLKLFESVQIIYLE